MVESEKSHVVIWSGLEIYTNPVFALLSSLFPSDLPPIPHFETLFTAFLSSIIALQMTFLGYAHIIGIALTLLRAFLEGYLWYLLRSQPTERHLQLATDDDQRPLSASPHSHNHLIPVLALASSFVVSLLILLSLSFTNFHLPQTLEGIPLHPWLFFIVSICLPTSSLSLLHLSPFLVSSTSVPLLALLRRNLGVLGLGAVFRQGGQLYHTLKITLSVTYTITHLLITSCIVLPSFSSFFPPLHIVADYFCTKYSRQLLVDFTIPLVLLLLANISYTFHSLNIITPTHTLDIVIAHYDKSLQLFASHISFFLSTLYVQTSQVRIFLYEKGGTDQEKLRDELPLVRGRDFVIDWENVGREGETYMSHISRIYDLPHPSSSLNCSSTSIEPSYGIAHQTFFLQSHLAWKKVAIPRISAIDTLTGFISLGPYMWNKCGIDGRGTGEYELMQNVWEIFKGRRCDKEKDGDKLSSWAGQFLVSRERVMRNEKGMYEEVQKLLSAPGGDPIHNHWAPIEHESPSEPAFGHAVERSWPLIFGCDDPTMVEKCLDESWKIEDCQCRD